MTGDARTRCPGFLRADETYEDLGGGMGVLQSKSGFRFGTDSILLADFAKPRRNARVADLGAGTGVLSILLARDRADISVCAVESDARASDLLARSIAMNALTRRVSSHAIDLRDAPARLGRGAFDYIVCNPPYQPAGSGEESPDEARARACHLREIALGEIALTAFQLLKSGGRAALCYPAARVHTLLDALARNRLAPKRIRAVQNRATDAPRLFLLDAVKLGGVALQWEKPLILRDARGEYSDEYRRIYHISEQN